MVIPLSLEMVPLRHIRTQLRVLRYSSGINPEFVPAGRMMAVCAGDGRWNPDPATTECTCKNNHCGFSNHFTSSPVAMMENGLISCARMCRVGLSVSFVHLSVCQRKIMYQTGDLDVLQCYFHGTGLMS